MGQEDINPCITCGACCALFRASFYWAEADDAGGTVPVDLTEQLNAFRRVMKGTNDPSPRCVALVGEIGRQIYCSIYDRRSSVCRDFPVAWENGLPNERCDKARLAGIAAPVAADGKSCRNTGRPHHLHAALYATPAAPRGITARIRGISVFDEKLPVGYNRRHNVAL